MRLVVGIVAEGGTDVAVIEEYLSAWLKRQVHTIDLQVRTLQPKIDATSGRFGDGGWTFVKAWCQKYPAHARAQVLFQPLFAGEPPADILIVQLDADAIREYAQPYNDIVVPANANASTRGAIVKQIQERWLWGSNEGRTADPHERRHCLVASVRALEAWLVAGLDPSIPEPEEIEDLERELMRLEPRLNVRVHHGVRRLRKSVKTWKKLAKKTRHQLPRIRAACPHCDAFLASIDALIQDKIAIIAN